jgi:hypothetical protein
MTRRTVDITLRDEGRDLKFRITKMSAWDQERFVFRAAIALGPSIGESDVMSLMSLRLDSPELAAGLLKALGGLDYEGKARPLLDELMGCVKRVEGNAEIPVTRETSEGFIGDFRTLIGLKKEILKFHFAPFTEGGAESPSDSPGNGNTSPQSGKGVRITHLS